MQNSALWSQFFFFFFKQKPPLAPTMLLSHCLTLFHPFSGYLLLFLLSSHSAITDLSPSKVSTCPFSPWSFLHPEPPLPPTPPHCVAAAQHHLQQMHEQDLLVVQVLFLLSVLHCISIVVHWVAFVTLDLFSLPSQGQNR